MQYLFHVAETVDELASHSSSLLASSILLAVGIGVVMATFLFMKRMSQVVEDGVELERLSAFQGEENWSDEHIPASLEASVYVKRVTGPLFFGFAQSFQQALQELPEVRHVILRLKRVPFVDQTGAYALEEAIRVLEARGVTVLISGLQEQPSDILRRLAIITQNVTDGEIALSSSSPPLLVASPECYKLPPNKLEVTPKQV